VRQRLAIPVLAALALALMLALPAGATRTAAAPRVTITACKSIILVSGPQGKYYKCTSVYTFGVPHTSTKLGLLVSNAGFPKGSKFSLSFLNSKTKQELASSVNFGPIRFDPGLWNLTFNGPFPAGLSMSVQPMYQGKPIQTPTLISFT
jgi:hypothetical protein